MPLTVVYDPYLILLSITVVVIGCYAGLFLLRQAYRQPALQGRLLLALAALTIGTSVWSMHFIGMLAVGPPFAVRFDLLITLISALISILVTVTGLIFAFFGKRHIHRIWLGGCVMGLGVFSMHYIGMEAIVACCKLVHDPILVAAAAVVGIAASVLAVWLMSPRQRHWPPLWAALAMGLAISAMHYTAMASGSFLPPEQSIENGRPSMDPTNLAIAVALATALLVGFAMLCGLPAMVRMAAQRDAVAQSRVRGGKEPVAFRRAAMPHRRPRYETPPTKVPGPRREPLVMLDMPRLEARDTTRAKPARLGPR